MDGESWETIAAHDYRIFTHNFSAGDDLIHGDHPTCDRTPDLQTSDHANIFTLPPRRTRHDRQKPRFLGVSACAGATGFAIEPDDATFKAALQSVGHFHTGDAVAPCLEVEQFGTNHFHRLAPVISHTHSPA